MRNPETHDSRAQTHNRVPFRIRAGWLCGIVVKEPLNYSTASEVRCGYLGNPAESFPCVALDDGCSRSTSTDTSLCLKNERSSCVCLSPCGPLPPHPSLPHPSSLQETHLSGLGRAQRSIARHPSCESIGAWLVASSARSGRLALNAT